MAVMLNSIEIILDYIPVLFAILLLFFFAAFFFRKNNASIEILSILSKNYYKKPSKPNYIQISLVFVLTVIVASVFSRLGVDVHHHGTMFQVAVRISEGKMLFKDVYFHYGALTALLQALAVWLFGKSLIVIQLQTALFYGFTSIFLWLVWSRFMPPILATITSVIWICMAPYFTWTFLPWSSVYSLFFMVLSLYLFIIFLEKEKLLYLYLTGVAVSLTFWSRQTVGILLFLSLLFIIILLNILQKTNIKNSLKEAGVFLGGNFTVSVVFLSWLLFNDAIGDWWIQVFLGQFNWAIGDSGGLLAVFLNLIKLRICLLPDNVWVIFPLVTILVLFCLLADIGINKKIRAATAILLSFVVVCLTSWHQYFPVPCIRHFYWAATPMMGLFTYYLWWSWKSTAELFKLNKIVLPIGLFLVALLSFVFVGQQIIYNIKTGINRLNSYRVEISSPEALSGMMVTDELQALSLKKIDNLIKKYLKNHPNASLISISNNTLFLSFIEHNEGFSPINTPIVNFDVFSNIYHYNDKLSDYIKEKKPLIFTHSPWSFNKYYELAHVLTKPTSEYDTGSWHLYAPVEQ